MAEAKKMQASIVKESQEAGFDPPPYVLLELIGKGSFGRVYKAVGTGRPEFVAVKIISIDEGDSLAPGAVDTYKDIMREIDTLKRLSNSGAKNVNTIIDTLLVNHSMWMITEHCAGGSVATLMKPTGFLAEKWIIPILREVALGLYWVHKQNIIHRDIKCANVLVKDDGGVQLCDFGVAGLVESKMDKRKTVTGTLQWMAPEFFDSKVAYGTEVDIWAFGSMAIEAATGAPPNAANIADITQFGSFLKDNCPRLEGDQYSPRLKDLVSCCMVQNPSARPAIRQIQNHPYIHNSENDYPTESLASLVDAYKIWEIQGGNRRSLFAAGGAQCHLSNESSFSETWNFEEAQDSNPLAFDTDAQKVHEAYGSQVDFPPHRPGRQGCRQRPTDARPLNTPLERVFDRNTLSNYKDYAQAFYCKTGRSFSNVESIRPKPDASSVRRPSAAATVSQGTATFDWVQATVPETTDLDMRNLVANISASPERLLTKVNHPKRPSTQEWKFPLVVSISPAKSSTHEPSRDGHTTTDSGADHAPLAVKTSINGIPPARLDLLPMLAAQANRLSSTSLIDLDACLPSVATHHKQQSSTPSIRSSGTASTGSSRGAPGHMEQYSTSPPLQPAYRPPSTYAPDTFSHRREPSLYVDNEHDSFFDTTAVFTPDNDTTAVQSDAQDTECDSELRQEGKIEQEATEVSDDPDATPRPRTWSQTEPSGRNGLPSVPEPPSSRVMQDDAHKEEVKAELRRLAASCAEHFSFLGDMLRGNGLSTMPALETPNSVHPGDLESGAENRIDDSWEKRAR